MILDTFNLGLQLAFLYSQLAFLYSQLAFLNSQMSTRNSHFSTHNSHFSTRNSTKRNPLCTWPPMGRCQIFIR